MGNQGNAAEFDEALEAVQVVVSSIAIALIILAIFTTAGFIGMCADGTAKSGHLMVWLMVLFPGAASCGWLWYRSNYKDRRSDALNEFPPETDTQKGE